MEMFSMDEIKSCDITKSLLQEMCVFLKTVCKHLPKNLQAQAETLIKKGNAIAKDTTHFKSEYYIDMNAKNGSFKNDRLSNEYSDTYVPVVPQSEYETPGAIIDLEQIRMSNTDEECPYAKKSYTELKEKSPHMAGILRRGRRFFGFCLRKYFVIIIENWLLLYLSEKDESPAHFCNLLTHQLTIDVDNERSFSIKYNDEILYTLIAANSKEREQWTTHINEKILCKKTDKKIPQSSLKIRKLPLIPTPKIPSIPTATIKNNRKLYPKYVQQTSTCSESPLSPSEIYTDMETTQSEDYAQVGVSENDEGNYTEAETILRCQKNHGIDTSTYETINVPGSPQYQNADEYFH